MIIKAGLGLKAGSKIGVGFIGPGPDISFDSRDKGGLIEKKSVRSAGLKADRFPIVDISSRVGGGLDIRAGLRSDSLGVAKLWEKFWQ